MGTVSVRYTVIRPYDERTMGERYGARQKKILSLFTRPGDEWHMRKIVDVYGKNETMKPDSYVKLVYKVLQTAAAAGILERRSEDRSVPDWFCDLESVGYWIGQLRHSTLRHMPRQAGTGEIYLCRVWRFNRWLGRKKIPHAGPGARRKGQL